MARLFRSLIFVPGNNPRFLEKAKSLEADIVCFDLEDSVPPPEKKAARRLVRAALRSRSQYGASIFVRTNAPASGMIPEDLRETVRRGIDGIVIPKVNSTGDLKAVERALRAAEKKARLRPIRIIPSIESAGGVAGAYEISSFSKRVCAVVFGVFDLLNDLGIEYTKRPAGAEYSRAKIPVDSRAAGVPAIDAIWQDLEDTRGLAGDCRLGKSLGYAGKSIIHPDQIETAHRIFHPNRTEIEWAKKVRDAYLKSAKKGKGATVVEGKMVDEAHYKQAMALLDLDGRA